MTPPTSVFSSCSSPLSAVRPPLCCPDQEELSAWNAPKNTQFHSIRPPPARRRQASSRIRQQQQQQFHVRHRRRSSRNEPMKRFRSSCSRSLSIAFLFCLFFLCRGTSAGHVYGTAEIFPGELLFDRRPPPPLPGVRMQLEERQDEGSASASLPEVTDVTITPTSGSPSATGSTISTASQTAAASLPRPFDTTLGNNFTSSTCPTFFSSFLNNSTFESCLPFSLLLQTSNGFFADSRSVVLLTQDLSATCNVDFDVCSNLMSSLAQQIGQQSACGADLQMQNPVVTQAYNGFIAYPTLYRAGCLTDAQGTYCFANAVTNTSATSSSYIYYLPLGVELPGGSRPACTKCLQDTMAIFAQTATNSSQPLSKDYVSAAQQIQMNCGPTFVETSVSSTGAAARGLSAPFAGFTGLVVLLSLLVHVLS